MTLLLVGLFVAVNLQLLCRLLPVVPKSAPWIAGFAIASVIGFLATPLWIPFIAPAIVGKRTITSPATCASTGQPSVFRALNFAFIMDGKVAGLPEGGNLMTENRNGLIIDAWLTEANGTAERATALDMIEDNARPGSTVAGDKNYDTAGSSPAAATAAALRISRRTTPTAILRSVRAPPPCQLSHQHDQAQPDRRTISAGYARRTLRNKANSVGWCCRVRKSPATRYEDDKGKWHRETTSGRDRRRQTDELSERRIGRC